MTAEMEVPALFRSAWTRGPVQNAALTLHTTERPFRGWRLLSALLSYWDAARAYYHFIFSTMWSMIITLTANPTLFIFQPVDAFISLFTYINLIIGVTMCSHLFLFLYIFGFGRVADRMTKAFTSTETMFSQSLHTVTKAKLVMGRTPSPRSPGGDEDGDHFKIGETSFGRTRKAYFNIDVAEFCLLMSTIVYQRNEMKIRDAVSLHQAFMRLPLEEQNRLGKEEHFEQVQKILKDSYKPVQKKADDWGVNFNAISDLSPSGGVFAAIFSCQNPPFVCVAFKGSSPFTITDWLTDASIQRTDARSFLFGRVHSGFYTSLFPDVTGSTPRSGVDSSYGSIILKVNQIIERLSTVQRVNVWVTGHSLGAALACLFHARLTKSPDDIPRGNLMQCMTFGTPAVGDGDFAFGYTAASNTPYRLDDQEILYRITNNRDVVARVPPPLAENPYARRFLDNNSAFNYSHIGTEVTIFPHGNKPYVQAAKGGKGAFLVFTTDQARGKDGKEVHALFPARGHLTTPQTWQKMILYSPERAVERAERVAHAVASGINLRALDAKEKLMRRARKPDIEGVMGTRILRFLPGFIADHSPIRYYESLESSRRWFAGDEGGVHF